MLKIINTLKHFFEDSYRRINIREYARLQKISPPSASKLLESLEKEGLLIKETEKRYIYYYANKDSKIFIDLSRIYWFVRFKNALLTEYLEKELINPKAILFGSFAKAEIKEDSDIDIAVFTASKKNLDMTMFEKKLNRKIQLFVFKNRESVKNKELLNNMLNGFVFLGEW